jgi:D-alanyl-D-alanine carboxypeptidase
MTTATLATDLREERHLARGYDEHDRDITPGDFSGPWAAGAVVASAADIAAFFRALHSGQLLPDAAVTDMTTSRGMLPEGFDYGLGTFIVTSGCGEVTGHFGEVDGFESAALYNPETGRVAVVLVNAMGREGRDATQRLSDVAVCF